MQAIFEILEDIISDLIKMATADGDEARIKALKATQRKLRAARDKRTGIKP